MSLCHVNQDKTTLDHQCGLNISSKLNGSVALSNNLLVFHHDLTSTVPDGFTLPVLDLQARSHSRFWWILGAGTCTGTSLSHDPLLGRVRQKVKNQRAEQREQGG